MVSQHGILLAAGLISDHFGPLVSKVCDCLLRHGALQLPDIVRRLKLSPGQVKNSLLVLIQHNCVQAFSSPRGKRTVVLYLAIFDNVLHRLRFPKFISVIGADIPEVAPAAMARELAPHEPSSRRRLPPPPAASFGQIRRPRRPPAPPRSSPRPPRHPVPPRPSPAPPKPRPVSSVSCFCAPADRLEDISSCDRLHLRNPSSQQSEALIEGLLQNGRLTFDQLVGRTISEVPEGTIRSAREEIRMNFNRLVYARYVERCPKPEPFFDPLVDEQPTPAKRRVPKIAEEGLSLEQKVVNTATLSDPERFSEIPYSMEDASKTNDCPHNAVAGVKRKHGAFEVDEELNSTIAENEVLWRVNFEKFMFCLKKKFCADRKKPKLKVGTHPIWESFFEANLIDNDTNSVTSSINGILEKLGQKEGGAAMTLDQITRVLEDLQCTTSSGNLEAFTFDLRKMVEACRNEEIESLVKKKYGQEAFTIFRLLVTQGCAVETDQIIDTTILDKQIVHSTLYKLWNDGYIDTEKIASAAGTGYAQFFVWRARNTFREQFIDNLYHAALNLRQMVNYIDELLVECSKDETKLIDNLTSCAHNILIALTRHDDSLMLFHDF